MVCQNLTAELSGGGNLSVNINGRVYPAALTVFRVDFALTDWTEQAEGYAISIPATMHNHGANVMTDAYFSATSGEYEKYYGYPSAKGWKIAVGETGDVTLWVQNQEDTFAGRLLIL